MHVPKSYSFARIYLSQYNNTCRLRKRAALDSLPQSALFSHRSDFAPKVPSFLGARWRGCQRLTLSFRKALHQICPETPCLAVAEPCALDRTRYFQERPVGHRQRSVPVVEESSAGKQSHPSTNPQRIYAIRSRCCKTTRVPISAVPLFLDGQQKDGSVSVCFCPMGSDIMRETRRDNCCPRVGNHTYITNTSTSTPLQRSHAGPDGL